MNNHYKTHTAGMGTVLSRTRRGSTDPLPAYTDSSGGASAPDTHRTLPVFRTRIRSQHSSYLLTMYLWYKALCDTFPKIYVNALNMIYAFV